MNFPSRRIVALFTALPAIAILGGCSVAQSQPKWAPVPGPETPGLMAGLHGTLVTATADDGIVVISLPSGRQSVLRPSPIPASGLGPATAVSGPDAAGQVAYFEELDKRFRLNVTSLSHRRTRTIFTRSESTIWGSVGRSFALSPVGNKVVFLSRLRDQQMENPQLIFEEGTVELWDIAHSTERDLTVPALDLGLSWFPDGKRLAYVQFDPISAVTDARDFGAAYAGWAKLPVTYVLDTVTGARTRLGVGWYPVVSTDGARVVLHNGQYHPRLVAASGLTPSVPISVPGLSNYVLSLDGKFVIYAGFPTVGRPQRLTKYNSPLSGPKEMPSVKVAVINSHQFQTIIPYHDMRDPISFGVQVSGVKE
jgi:hypothetical protein